MRLILLTLLLIAAVDGGIIDKVKGAFSGEGSFGQKLKNATIVGFKKLLTALSRFLYIKLQLFENTALFKIRDKIRSMKDKVLKTLELTPKMMKSLEERLKRLRPIKKDKVAEKGDSITEVNEYSQPKHRHLWYSGRWMFGLLYVGKLGGEQKLSLGRGCETVSIAAHELGHALGFFHTMSRHDRDEFITVNKHNIKCIVQTKKPTMVPFDVDYQQTLGSPFISFIELSMLNEHYGCKENCNKATSVKCEMGGFPHPRDCQKCICPGGYAGPRCTERVRRELDILVIKELVPKAFTLAINRVRRYN
ncbi:astacin [Cooperia oncophora]